MEILDDDLITEYHGNLTRLHKNKREQLEVARVRRKLRLQTIQKRFEAEIISAHQDLLDKKVLLFDKMKENIQKKITRVDDEMFENEMEKRRALEAAQVLVPKRNTRQRPLLTDDPAPRKKPVDVKGPYVVYMLTDEEIEEDLRIIRRSLWRREPTPESDISSLSGVNTISSSSGANITSSSMSGTSGSLSSGASGSLSSVASGSTSSLSGAITSSSMSGTSGSLSSGTSRSVICVNYAENVMRSQIFQNLLNTYSDEQSRSSSLASSEELLDETDRSSPKSLPIPSTSTDHSFNRANFSTCQPLNPLSAKLVSSSNHLSVIRTSGIIRHTVSSPSRNPVCHPDIPSISSCLVEPDKELKSEVQNFSQQQSSGVLFYSPMQPGSPFQSFDEPIGATVDCVSNEVICSSASWTLPEETDLAAPNTEHNTAQWSDSRTQTSSEDEVWSPENSCDGPYDVSFRVASSMEQPMPGTSKQELTPSYTCEPSPPQRPLSRLAMHCPVVVRAKVRSSPPDCDGRSTIPMMEVVDFSESPTHD